MSHSFSQKIALRGFYTTDLREGVTVALYKILLMDNVGYFNLKLTKLTKLKDRTC